MLLVGAIRFEGRFCASKKAGVEEVGIFKTCCAHGGCLGWLWNVFGRHWLDHFSHVSTNGCRNYSSSCSKGTISGTVGSFWSRGVLAGRRALTIESLLMTQALTNYSSNISVTYKLWLLNSNLRGICHRLLTPQIMWHAHTSLVPRPRPAFHSHAGLPPYHFPVRCGISSGNSESPSNSKSSNIASWVLNFLGCLVLHAKHPGISCTPCQVS